MGKHVVKPQQTVKTHDLHYWWEELQTAKAADTALYIERAYDEIDRLLDHMLAAR